MALARPRAGLDHRLALRLGLEFVHASGSGKVSLDAERSFDASATVAGVLVPVDFGFAVVSTEIFELLLRAGGALRFESAGLEVLGDRPGGGSRVGFGARFGVDADLRLPAGSVVLGVGLGGLGASAGGFSGATTTYEGSLTAIRAEVGFRFWL